MTELRALLKDENGSENISKVILIAIAFTVGGILLLLFAYAFKNTIAGWYNNVTKDWFDNSKMGYHNVNTGV